MIFALSQETKHPDLKVFFSIQFDRTGNTNTNINNISRFSCSYTLNFTANTYNETKTEITNHYLLMKEPVKLNHLLTPFQVDF